MPKKDCATGATTIAAKKSWFFMDMIVFELNIIGY